MTVRPDRRAAPPSGGAGPVAVLVALALVPALVLAAAWRWADGRAAGSVDPVPATSSTAVATPPAPALATPLQSLRRTPTALARDLNLERFRSDVAPLLAAVNERSCVSVGLDGIDVGATNAALAVIPGSVMKLVVAAAALEVLGESFTYTTRVLGTVAGGVVQGDLYLVGGGDPLLSGDWYASSNLERFPVFGTTSLDQLADQVVAAGVTSISGAVLGDGSRYDDEWFAPGWGVGVAGLGGGPYDALLVNDSRVQGEDLRADDPNAAGARELARMLAARGVTIAGGSDSGTAPAGTPEITSVASQPLPVVLAEMLTNSDNNTAELVTKEIGLAAAGQGTRAAGLEAMRSLLASWGLDLTSVVLADGSGLSLDNRLTCAALMEVLRRTGADTPIGQGLAIAGQTGTLADVFEGSAVDGRMRAKTGTLNNPPFDADPPAVKALAGYLPVDGGGEVEFALVLNGATISDQSEYRPVWDLLAQVLASYPSGPGPDVLGPR